MSRKLAPLAIAYDFDGTLAPGNMQERDFIPSVGMTSSSFWKEVSTLSEKHEADNILVYMGLMLKKAKIHEIQVRKSNFAEYGRNLDLFDGVSDWFNRINIYGKQSGVRIEHYIISSGIREMIEGTKISKFFKMIYASSFWYDHHGIAEWPAMALNYTTKTQYLFRINKGSLHVHDHSMINDFVPHESRAIPFKNMIFIGDGETDIPCFRLVKDQGGHAIAVYKPNTRGAKTRPTKLINEGRVNFMATADYQEDSELDRIVKGVIDKISADDYLNSLKPKV